MFERGLDVFEIEMFTKACAKNSTEFKERLNTPAKRQTEMGAALVVDKKEKLAKKKTRSALETTRVRPARTRLFLRRDSP